MHDAYSAKELKDDKVEHLTINSNNRSIINKFKEYRKLQTFTLNFIA